MTKKLVIRLAVGFLLSFCCFEAFGIEDDIDFEYRKINFRPIYNFFVRGMSGPIYPKIDFGDKLAFSVARVYTVLKPKSLNSGTGAQRVPKGHINGTGFFVWSPYRLREPIRSILFNKYDGKIYNYSSEPLLITCEHCVEKEKYSTAQIRIYVYYHNPSESKDTNKDGLTRLYLVEAIIDSPFENNIIATDKTRDISVIRLGKTLEKYKKALDKKFGSVNYPFFESIGISKPPTFDREEIGYFSDVIMLGYPNGRNDSSGLPLARFGHCSSDPKQALRDGSTDGEPDFYVDMIGVSGSSGSPVWLSTSVLSGEVYDSKVVIGGNNETHDDSYLSSNVVKVSESKIYYFVGMFYEGMVFPLHEIDVSNLQQSDNVGLKAVLKKLSYNIEKLNDLHLGGGL